MAHDRQRHDRATSRAARVILALKDEQPEAVHEVLTECRGNVAQLHDLVVTLGALAAVRYDDADAIVMATATADKLAGEIPGSEGLGR